MKAALLLAAAVGCGAGSVAVTGWRAANVERFAAAFVRPALLPFLWRGLGDATLAGDPAAAYAKAQQLMRVLPGWIDGHVVFAWRYALDGGAAPAGDARAAAAAALRRLDLALAWLQAARASAGKREVELLQAMAFLVEIAAARQPGMPELLHARQAGGAAAIADGWLAEAERRGDGRSVREQRTFAVPALAAGFLHAGEKARAIEVLELAIARTAEVREADLAAEWRANLRGVVQILRGEDGVDRAPLLADPRLEPLRPWFR